MIYRLVYRSLINDFIVIEERQLKSIRSACRMSRFQMIDLSAVEIRSSSDEGGIDFPEFYYDEAIPLFSEELFAKMKEHGVDNLLEKQVTVVCEATGEKRRYILGLPPRIDALRKNALDKLEIDISLLGNFKIFKLAGVPDNNIYITDELKALFDELTPLGLGVVDVLHYDSRA